MKTILLGACALLLLSACGKHEPAAADTDAPRAAPAAAADAAAAAAAGAAKLRDGYRARLVPLLTGSYAGSCQIARGSDAGHLAMAGGPARGKIEIGADGQVAALGAQHDLLHGTDGLLFTRMLEGGKALSATAVTGATEPAWTLTVQSGREDQVHLTGDTSAIDCGALEQALTLRDKALWPFVAGFFSSAAGTLVCTRGGAVTPVSLAIKPGPAGVDIGGRQFAFDQGLLMEMTGFDKDKDLTYAADYADGVKLMMSLDREGRLAQLITAGKQEDVLDCHREGAN